jgi:HD-like signal output (HDOD) protein
MENQDTSVLSKLLNLIDTNPGFAGLGASIQTISRLTDAEDGGTQEITAAILRDAALTAKLLRLSNSSRNARGGRNVSTVDQAIAILGLNTVKSVALSLALLDTLSHKPQSRQLHAEIVAAYYCGSLAAEITRLYAARYGAQEAQVCGLMQNLGRMMALYHLYEEIERSRALQAEKNLTEEDAILQTLGISFEDIGAAIAQHWNLPDVLQQSMATKVGKAPPRVASSSISWHQLCALFARHITDALFRLPESREKIEIHNDIEFFRGALHLKDIEVHECIEKTLVETDRLLGELGFPCNVEEARTLLRKASERVLDLLSSQDSLTKEGKLVEGKTPVEIFQQTLHHFHDKFGFDRTLLCLPDGSSGLVAIAGVGRNASQIAARFRCVGAKPDIFRIVLTKKVDMYIADAQAPSFASYIPDWYPGLVGARSFMLLPLVHEGQALGLLYGDYAELHPNAPQGISSQEDVKAWRAQLQSALQTKPGKAAH